MICKAQEVGHLKLYARVALPHGSLAAQQGLSQGLYCIVLAVTMCESPHTSRVLLAFLIYLPGIASDYMMQACSSHLLTFSYNARAALPQGPVAGQQRLCQGLCRLVPDVIICGSRTPQNVFHALPGVDQLLPHLRTAQMLHLTALHMESTGTSVIVTTRRHITAPDGTWWPRVPIMNSCMRVCCTKTMASLHIS